MASTENDVSYYVRVRDRAAGPYTLKQLNTFRVRGQFTPANEISLDGRTWESAASLTMLFGSPEKKSSKKDSATVVVVEAVEPVVTEVDEAHWHYSIDGTQQGPVTLAELQEMLDLGQLGVLDLVWKEGMADWVSVTEIAELRLAALPERSSKPKSSSRVSTSIEIKPDGGIPSHFLDSVLQSLRRAIDESSIVAVGRNSVELGRYSIYLAMVLNLVFSLIYAVRAGIPFILVGTFAFATVALVLQYSAIKSCGAIAQLIRTTTLRMSSTAFIDSMIIILFIAGLVGLLGCVGGIVAFAVGALASLGGSGSSELVLGIVGIIVFLFCEQLALALLHPGAMGITISDRTRFGEEAIAIVSFFMMVPLRLVPTIFGIGSFFSSIGMTVAIGFLLMSRVPSTPDPLASVDAFQTSLSIFGKSGLSALACAAFPIVAYLYFVFAYLGIDLIRSILVVPDKLDALTQSSAQIRDGTNAGANGVPVAAESAAT